MKYKDYEIYQDDLGRTCIYNTVSPYSKESDHIVVGGNIEDAKREIDNRTLTHGGSRPGAGRPPAEEPRKARTFKATDAEWEQIQTKARKVGMNASEYIRSKTLND